MANGPIELSVVHESPKAAITRPWQHVGVTLTSYFWRRWKPVLGPDYTILILDLRILVAEQLGQGNVPTSGKVTVQVDRRDLAERTGLSLRTIERLLSPGALAAEPVASFLTSKAQYAYDEGLGKKVRTANAYTISMDDPVHPDDLQEGEAPSRLPAEAPQTAARDLERTLRDRIPELAVGAIRRLLREKGAEVLLRQLDWLPHRDIGWAKNSAAAFAYYCEHDEPEPESLRRARAAQEKARVRKEAEVKERLVAEERLVEDVAAHPGAEVWHKMWDHTSVKLRAIYRRDVRLGAVDDQSVTLEVLSPDIGRLLRTQPDHRKELESAVVFSLDRDVRVEWKEVNRATVSP